MSYQQVRDLRNRGVVGRVQGGGPKIAVAGPSLAAVPARSVDAANAKTNQAAGLVDVLQQKLAAQHTELESRTDSINQIQRNFEKLHERLMAESTSHTRLTEEVKSLQRDKIDLTSLNTELSAQVEALQSQLAEAYSEGASTTRAAEDTARALAEASRAVQEQAGHTDVADRKVHALQAEVRALTEECASAHARLQALSDTEALCRASLSASDQLRCDAKAECETGTRHIREAAAAVEQLKTRVSELRDDQRRLGGVLSAAVVASERVQEELRGAPQEAPGGEIGAGDLLSKVHSLFVVEMGKSALRSALVLWVERAIAQVGVYTGAKQRLLAESRCAFFERRVKVAESQAAVYAGVEADVREGIRARDTAIAALERQVEALRGAAVGSATAVTKTEKECVALRSGNQRLAARCGELEAALAAASDNKSDEVRLLEGILDERQNAVAQAEASATMLSEQLATVGAECDRLRQALREHESAQQAAEGARSHLQQSLDEARRRSESLEEGRYETAERLAAVEIELRAVEAARDGAERAASAAEAMLSAKQSEMEDSIQRAGVAAAEATEARNDLNARLSAIREQRAALQHAFGELNGFVAKLQHADGTVESAVTCMICMRVLTCAKTLPCGHTACTACVAKTGSVCGDCSGPAHPALPATGMDVVAANFNYRVQALRGLRRIAESLKARLEMEELLEHSDEEREGRGPRLEEGGRSGAGEAV